MADYAIGSSLECAACLDLARIKELLSSEECQQAKRQVCEITRMLIGLRKAWNQSIAQEDPIAYTPESNKLLSLPLFHHEQLEVYRTALGFMEWFVSQPQAKALSHRLLRQIDEAGTSVVLNIAEGNGRFAELDHHRFLQIAETASVKAAVYLDLGAARGLLSEVEAAVG